VFLAARFLVDLGWWIARQYWPRVERRGWFLYDTAGIIGVVVGGVVAAALVWSALQDNYRRILNERQLYDERVEQE
jgi:uncharacterized membrane protein YeaQ/YmgE (transglycosylase-associated protein family)